MRVNAAPVLLAGVLLAGVLLANSARAAVPSDAVPVVVGTVTRETVPIELGGLGTVQAWRSVTVRARVGGPLTSVAVHEGQRVAAGDVLATVDPRLYAATLDGARAKLTGEMATLANAEVTVARDRALLVQHVVSSQQADNDTALAHEAASSVAADQAAVASAALDLSFCRITAPIGGVAGFRLVDVGNLVGDGADDAIVRLAEVQPIAVVFTLPASAIAALAGAGRTGSVSVRAVDPESGRTVETGTIVAFDNTIDATTGTISVKAVFGNGDDRLWPGQSIDAVVDLGERRGVLVAPVGAVQHGPDGLFVFAVGRDMRVAVRPVRVADGAGGVVIVTAGLTAGDRVVTDGQSRLDDGVAIEPVASGNR